MSHQVRFNEDFYASLLRSALKVLKMVRSVSENVDATEIGATHRPQIISK
jgi:hypothetical protein